MSPLVQWFGWSLWGINSPWCESFGGHHDDNSAGFGVNWFEQKIVPIKGQTFISWSQLVASLKW